MIIVTIRQFAEVARQLIIILLISNVFTIGAVCYLLKDKIDREQEQLNNRICQEEMIPTYNNNFPPFEIIEE